MLGEAEKGSRLSDNATEDFIRCFEEIKAEINRRAGNRSPRSFAVESAAERDGLVRKNKAVLHYIREVRNALQHPGHRSAGSAIKITDSFLSEVRDLLRHLQNPPKANSVGVPRKKVLVGKLTDRLGDLADKMKTSGFSHLPLLNESDAVIGVFNEAAVFDHLWSDDETIVGRNMVVGDILSHCRLDAEHTETFRFVKPSTPLDDLMSMFLNLESPTTRVGAAFVTASGKRHEALQRLITPWDVLASAAA
jgi:CBS domain-containing protein